MITERNMTLNFVTDCGADPTGATSSGPALNKAGTILSALAAAGSLLPKQTCTLYVPTGVYLISGSLSVWDFTSGPTNVRIVGDGDGSIFQLNCPGQSALAISNPVNILIQDLAFVGTQSVTNPDCADAIYVVTQAGYTTIRRVHMDWVRGSRSLIYVNTGSVKMDTCRFTGSGSDGACLNIPNSVGQCDISDVDWIAESQLNGFASTSAQWKSYSPNLWCKITGAGSITSGYVQSIKFSRCQFDWSENAGAVVINGGNSNNIERFRMEDCLVYPSQYGSPSPAIQLTDVNFVDIDGLTNIGNSTLAQPFIAMTGVQRARLRNLTAPASNCLAVTADSTSGYVEFDACDSTVLSAVSSSAARTTAIDSATGTKQDVFASGAAITTNYLCKSTTAGQVLVAGVGDDAGALLGPCTNGPTAASQVALVAREGQPVMMVSDGATAISAGDKIVPSAATAGQVKKSTTAGTGIVGVALTAAAATAGTSFQVMSTRGVV